MNQAGALPNNSSIEWFMDGILLEGESGVTLTVTETALEALAQHPARQNNASAGAQATAQGSSPWS